jgi:hypothetical protein
MKKRIIMFLWVVSICLILLNAIIGSMLIGASWYYILAIINFCISVWLFVVIIDSMSDLYF